MHHYQHIKVSFLIDSRIILTHTCYQIVEAARTISASAIHESRQILHQHPNHASQISFVLQELANLYDACAPYLTDVRQSLAQQQQQQQSAHVLRTARIVQTLSLCHHFLGSILSCVQESDHPSSEAWTPLSTAQHASASSNISNSSNDMKRRRDDDGDAGPSSKR
jgi:hypothetical protein